MKGKEVNKPWKKNESKPKSTESHIERDAEKMDEFSHLNTDEWTAEMIQGMQELQEAASDFFRIPVFFSHQNLFRLGTKEKQFIIRMFQEIKKELLFPRTLPNTEQYPDTTVENVRRVVKSSYGTIAALLVQTAPTSDNELYSPFMQLEPAMAYQYGHPLLLVIQRKRQGNNLPDLPQAGGIWRFSPFTPIEWFSDTVSVDEFFDSVQWKEVLKMWAGQVRSGYFIQTGPEYKYKCDD